MIIIYKQYAASTETATTKQPNTTTKVTTTVGELTSAYHEGADSLASTHAPVVVKRL